MPEGKEGDSVYVEREQSVQLQCDKWLTDEVRDDPRNHKMRDRVDIRTTGDGSGGRERKDFSYFLETDTLLQDRQYTRSVRRCLPVSLTNTTEQKKHIIPLLRSQDENMKRCKTVDIGQNEGERKTVPVYWHGCHDGSMWHTEMCLGGNQGTHFCFLCDQKWDDRACFAHQADAKGADGEFKMSEPDRAAYRKRLGRQRQALDPACAHARDGTCCCADKLGELCETEFPPDSEGRPAYDFDHERHTQIVSRAYGNAGADEDSFKGHYGRPCFSVIPFESKVPDVMHMEHWLRKIVLGLLFAAAETFGRCAQLADWVCDDCDIVQLSVPGDVKHLKMQNSLHEFKKATGPELRQLHEHIKDGIKRVLGVDVTEDGWLPLDDSASEEESNSDDEDEGRPAAPWVRMALLILHGMAQRGGRSHSASPQSCFRTENPARA
jgi:hypothetical protein